MKKLIYSYIFGYTSDDFYLNGKIVWITKHAIKRALEREIAWPDQVYALLRTGKMKTFGKNGIKIIKKNEDSSIICIGQDVGDSIIIKTIERGN